VGDKSTCFPSGVAYPHVLVNIYFRQKKWAVQTSFTAKGGAHYQLRG